jgi:carnitine O-acetyltransferase
VQFDTTGKVSFDNIYTRPDPRAYFNTLRELDYCIPQLAKPHFSKLIEEYRKTFRVSTPTVLDLGCSYGVNGALLKCDLTMNELYDRYCDRDAGGRSRQALLARDRELVRSRVGLRDARVVGLDSSDPALSYARHAGFIDGAIHADLEDRDPSEEQRAQLAAADLVISTGCLGYISHRTLARVVQAHERGKPWMAHFVLRMFPFDPIAESLAELGYDTVRHERVFKQRRFASSEEQARVLDTLASVGVSPRGLEVDGWLYAQLYLSRPRTTRRRAIVDLAPKKELSVL